MIPAYVSLFEKSHQEELLKEVDGALLSKIRAENITIWCLADYLEPHVVVLQGNRSSVAVLTDGYLPAYTIIVNHSQSCYFAKELDTSVGLALTLTVAHEWQHLVLMRREGLEEACSESRVWDEVSKLNLCSGADLANYRNYAMFFKSPNFDKRRLDTRPEFLKTFDQFKAVLGYRDAWGGAYIIAQRQGLADWRIQELLLENGWDFHASYDLLFGSPEAGLTRHAVLNHDCHELDRLVQATKPKPVKPIPPEQPLPLNYRIGG